MARRAIRIIPDFMECYAYRVAPGADLTARQIRAVGAEGTRFVHIGTHPAGAAPSDARRVANPPIDKIRAPEIWRMPEEVTGIGL